jgi:tetratricopeptide (TPR) repeat protein
VSPPSCLPSAAQLRDQVLSSFWSRLRQSPSPATLARLEQVPLELLLQVVKDVFGENFLRRLLRPLTLAEPNAVHMAVAQLAKRGVTQVAFTVNFDILLERALRMLRVPYRVHAGEEVPPPAPEDKGAFVLYKLHGSLDVPTTLFATLDRVGLPLSHSRRSALIDVLRKQHVYFVGYKGADADIRPTLLEEFRTTIATVKWNSLDTSGVDPDILQALPKTAFELGDCLQFVHAVLRTNCRPHVSYRAGRRNEVATTIVRILGHVGDTDGARDVVEGVWPGTVRSPRRKLSRYHALFRADVRRGSWDAALRWLTLADQIMKDPRVSNDPLEQFRWRVERGKFLLGMGDTTGVTELRQALIESEQLENEGQASWYRFVLLSSLLEGYPERLAPGEDPDVYVHELYSLAGTHVQLRSVAKRTEGILRRRQGKSAEAVRLLEGSLPESRATADHNGMLVALRELAGALAETGRFEEAHERLGEAEQIVAEMNLQNPIREAELEEEKAYLYFMQHREDEAQRAVARSAAIYEAIGAPVRAARVRTRMQQVGVGGPEQHKTS